MRPWRLFWETNHSRRQKEVFSILRKISVKYRDRWRPLVRSRGVMGFLYTLISKLGCRGTRRWVVARGQWITLRLRRAAHFRTLDSKFFRTILILWISPQISQRLLLHSRILHLVLSKKPPNLVKFSQSKTSSQKCCWLSSIGLIPLQVLKIWRNNKFPT